MENYVLYHEIYKKDGMIMYKGRKKGTITYVAVSCIEKDQRIKVTNHVRIVYDLIDKYVVRFYEWYETSNHLWLVTDLCVGGSLQQMLLEDISFPESSIRVFGAHLVRGLHYLHSRDVVCGQWHPSKIVLDGSGTLKYFDFSDSKKLNEDYDELVQRFFAGLNVEVRDMEELFDFRRPTAYTAPELLQGGQPDAATDIWGLGCLLFHMFAGQAPFGNGSGQDDQLVQNIIHGPPPPFVVRKSAVSRLPTSRASPDLADLLEQMLHKRPESRISLEALVKHRFWEDALLDLTKPTTAFDSSSSITMAAGDRSAVRPKTATQLASTSDDDSVATVATDDASFVLHLGSRQMTAATDEGDTRSRRNLMQLEPAGESSREPPGDPNVPAEQQSTLMDIACASTANVETNRGRGPIDDYTRMLKDGRLKFDGKLLAVTPLSAVKLRGMRRPERDKHLHQIELAVKQVEKGPPSQRRLHLINYLAQIAMATDVSNYCMESGVANELCRQLKTTSNQELMVRICQVLAIMLHYHSGNSAIQCCGEMISVLGDVLRDQFRCARIKLAAMTALGEALVRQAQLTTTSDETTGAGEPPALGLFVTLINRCLHRSEEVALNMVAARTIEMVADQTAGTIAPLALQLANIETMQQLFGAYKHASIDSLKASAISAMARLARIDCVQFCGLLDRTGSAALLENAHVAPLVVQEAVLEIFASAMLVQPSAASVRKLGQDSVFLRSIMRLMESPAALVRAKSLLVVLLLCRSDLALLRAATELRLVLYLEREYKRAKNASNSAGGTHDAMDRCLDAFSAFIGDRAVPSILDQCCSALDAVQGRKHPSSLQTRALRASVPMLECVSALASSPSLRVHVLTDRFCAVLARLVIHAGEVDSGQTNVGADIGPIFVTHVLALAEAASMHCWSESGGVNCGQLMAGLALVTGGSSNGDVRIIGLKLCGDIIALIAAASNDSGENDSVVADAVEMHLLPQMQRFASDPEPSAVYLLRLLRNYLLLSSERCITSLRQHRFPHILVQLLVNHQQRIMSATVIESLLLVSAIGEMSTDMLRDCILDVDLVAHLCDIVFEIGDIYHKDDMASMRTPKTSELMQAGIEALYGLAKLISDLVKKAMKSRKCHPQIDDVTARLTSEAEELLVKGKPLTETVDLLIYTFGGSADGSDLEAGESAIKLLHQIVSLYGGQQIYHGLSEPNMQLLCHCIASSPSYQHHTRTLLRILKRLLVSGTMPTAAAQSISTIVRETISTVTTRVDVQADTVSTGIINEIIKCIDS